MLPFEEIIIGKENYTNEVREAFLTDLEGELATAESEQIKLMEAEKRVSGGERKNLPFGRLRMKVCQEVYHFWGRKLGYECWKDKGFLDWFENRFKELVSIKSKSAELVI
jgi:hypothetical protein